MLMAEGLQSHRIFFLEDCKEPSVLFEEPANLSSVKCLEFMSCKMESMPKDLKFLSSLESLYITRKGSALSGALPASYWEAII
jgi:hypothetical protein